MKNLLLLICLCSPFVGAYAQRTLHLKTGQITDKIESTIPYRDIEKTDDGYLVTYTFEKAVIQDDPLFEGTVFWKVEGFGLNDISGEAEYLFRKDLFVVPANTKPVVEVVDSSFADFQYELTPARLPLFNNDDIGYNKKTVKPIVPFEGFQPSTLAFLFGISNYRGQGLCYATVRPIQYNYKEKTVRAYSSITYKVTFEPSGEIESEGSTDDKLVISVSDDFLNNIAIGGETAGQAQPLSLHPDVGPLLDVRDYLILSTNEFSEAVNRFADWKRLLGFNVHIVLRDYWTSDLVESTVSEMKSNYLTLYYLLIVGDQDDVPGEHIPAKEYLDSRNDTIFPGHVTDSRYGVNGDYYPFSPIQRGRLSVSSSEEANIVVDKIISYEKTPPSNTSYYNKGINCAYFQDRSTWYRLRDGYADRRFAQTAEEIRNYVISQGKSVQRIYYTDSIVTPTHWNNDIFSFGEEIPTELLRNSGFNWDGGPTDITNAINQGAFYVLHRDHGAVTAWGQPYYTKDHIDSLNNQSLLPVVFSMNCLTGRFDTDCFAEAFLRKNAGGCVAIYAASQISYSGYNDALTNGMFDAIWPSPGLRITFPYCVSSGSPSPTPTYTLGQILAQGFVRMEETFGSNSIDGTMAPLYNEYTKEIFHCFGDPSMMIYTEQPTAFENVEVSYQINRVSVCLAPGETARITFYDKNSGNVTSYFGNNANFATFNPYGITVCVSAHNKKPYIKEGTLYIQNETVSGMRTYNAGQILVGSSVTTERPNGNAVFNNGMIKLNADKVVLDAGTTIKLGTNLRITNE